MSDPHRKFPYYTQTQSFSLPEQQAPAGAYHPGQAPSAPRVFQQPSLGYSDARVRRGRGEICGERSGAGGHLLDCEANAPPLWSQPAGRGTDFSTWTPEQLKVRPMRPMRANRIHAHFAWGSLPSVPPVP